MNKNRASHKTRTKTLASGSPPGCEETLDPDNWEEMRGLGHRMVDEMLAFLKNIRERPAWQRVPDEVREHLAVPLPLEPQGAESAYRDFKKDVLPYSIGIHPRFWAWVHGTGSPGGMLAEMLCGGLNSSLHAGEHSPMYVEQQVLSWLKEALGYPAEASGLLVGGGSMANFIGLAVARNAKAGWDVKKEGMCGAHGPLVVYSSTETHSSVQKSVEALGLGSQGLRYIEADGNFRIRMDALQDAVAGDRQVGKVPICVIGNARNGELGCDRRSVHPLRVLSRRGPVVPRRWRIRSHCRNLAGVAPVAAWHGTG